MVGRTGTTMSAVLATAAAGLAVVQTQASVVDRRAGPALTITADGAIKVGDMVWFHFGNVTVTVGNSTYSTHDGSLKANGDASTSSGSDGYGAYEKKQQTYTAGSTPFIAAYRVYASRGFVVFEQNYPSGAEGTSAKGDVSSCWPSINPTPVGGANRGYVSWQGRFLEASRGGIWQEDSTKRDPGIGTGDGGGPFVVFGDDMSNSLVFSAVSNFMTNSWGMSPMASDNSFCAGLDGPVESVPAGYSLETMIMLGTGVNSAMKSFGTILLSKYKTVRPEDYSTKWLGFSTDNGAYYYYGWHTTPDISNYQQALEGVHAYAKQENIPYKHILLDSWWYTKGNAGGLKEWDATNSTFPDGLEKFAQKTGWKFQMHNRMWSNNNVYAKQNGGKYNFIVEPSSPVSRLRDVINTTIESGPEALHELELDLLGSATPGESGLAIPDDQHLWDDLMSNKTSRGIPLVVYEQDWMYNEWQGLLKTRTSPTLSREWLMQMGAGAAKSNVTIQYCMTFARMVLQSVEIPAVTQFRASDDYGPGQTGYYPTQKPGQPPTDGSKGCGFPYCVYYVGTTSILAWALQLGPSKDNFWSKPLQPGSAFNRGPDPWHPGTLNSTHEPYNEMQCAISSYTTGPVTPSDGIGYSNASLIKMACRADGYLLHPTAPARAIDASFALSGAPIPHVNNVHPIMSTYTEISGNKWGHVLVIGLNNSFELQPSHLGDDIDDGDTYVAWWGYQVSDSIGQRSPNVTLAQHPITSSTPLEIPACGYSDFGLYHLAPVHPKSDALFLGEIGKWVPVSEGRISSISDTTAGLSVDIVGEEGEHVELAFAKNGIVSSAICVIGTQGTAVVIFDGHAVVCK